MEVCASLLAQVLIGPQAKAVIWHICRAAASPPSSAQSLMVGSQGRLLMWGRTAIILLLSSQVLQCQGGHAAAQASANISYNLHSGSLVMMGCGGCRYQQPLAPAPYGAVASHPGMYMQHTYQGEVRCCTCQHSGSAGLI